MHPSIIRPWAPQAVLRPSQGRKDNKPPNGPQIYKGSQLCHVQAYLEEGFPITQEIRVSDNRMANQVAVSPTLSKERNVHNYLFNVWK